MFKIVFTTVLIMLIYLLCGYILVKFNKAVTSHAKSLSGVLVYVCTPCMIINSVIQMEYSIGNMKKSFQFFLITFILQFLISLFLYILLKKKLGESKYRILIVGTVMGNVGFMGVPIVTALFPHESIVSCYSTMFLISMNLIIFTLGVYLITNDKKFISLKSALLNPSSIALYVAIILYLLQVKLPNTILNSLGLFSKMTTPLCMIILGMRLASMDLKEIFTNKFAYLACFFKLIVFPLLAFVLINNFISDNVFKMSAVVLCSAPSAVIMLSLAELHEKEQKLCANILLLSTILSVFTMPLITLIFG